MKKLSFEHLSADKFTPLPSKQMHRVLGGQATGSGSYVTKTESRDVTQTINGKTVTITQHRDLVHSWSNDFDPGPNGGPIQEINPSDNWGDWR